MLVSDIGKIDFDQAWRIQKQLFELRRSDQIKDIILLCEHPHTITLGKSGSQENLLITTDDLADQSINYVEIDRGGDITYHGPGQLVAYPIINLNNYFRDAHKYLRFLEDVIIKLLAIYQIEGGRIDGLTGVWVGNSKICAIGVKISRWITMHGLAFNVSTDLNYFQKIVPCGISDKSVCNLSELIGKQLQLSEVSSKMIDCFETTFDISCQPIEKNELIKLLSQ